MSAISSKNVEHVLRTVFRRCVQCDKQIPSCGGSCPAGQLCVQAPPNCSSCATASCKAKELDPTETNNRSSSGPNVGAIAGGVVGGVVFIAIATFIIWKYCLKGRRRKHDEGEWQEVDMTQEKVDHDFASRRSARASTHTVASMASSVLTRASNIIQIAYIPGVTNRSGPGSPDLLVPPVPPIPAMSPSSGLSSPYSASEQHFFVPDFRDSMASQSTDASYARTSFAPSMARTSVASTVYRQNAIVSPLPAQTIVRGKAAVVSVKSSGSNSPLDTPGAETPPVPLIDPKHTAQPIRIQMPRMTSNASSLSPQNSVRSTATLGPVRALNITKKKTSFENSTPKSSSSSSTTAVNTPSPEPLVPPMRPLTEVSVASTEDSVPHARARKARDVDSDSESDDDDHSRARRSLLSSSSNFRDSEFTDISDTPVTMQSPFSDPSPTESDIPQRHASASSGLRAPMTPIAEESSKRASRASRRTQSPFSDDNATD
ncbi:uncharacterized protein BDR25DRAFT_101279 [Lindgomyces ingoldianus]|uniref:Uncharacterized protein n=1 Tax=Lindgomyces ingoldianus TaxID=673940 RepID=A0ACB6R8A6_9PLEO|nr:uncharacterized protein BDR25DRAFT_101279 [Lindgomyces ingoldianus]KAF2475275.1 hypothetical protein BDR25DRAFT_101279 [Lindgomyces ingoldianus]